MSFTFLPNIPGASDLISSSQAQIQENFQFLGDTSHTHNVDVVLGLVTSTGGWYKLPNGVIIQYFNAKTIVDNSVIPYITSFSIITQAIIMQPVTNMPDEEWYAFVKTGTVTNSQVTVRTNRTWTNGWYFVVIGI